MAFEAPNMKGAGGGAGGIAGMAFEAPNMKGAGGGAGRIAGKASEAPNMWGAGGGAGRIAGEAPSMKGAEGGAGKGTTFKVRDTGGREGETASEEFAEHRRSRSSYLSSCLSVGSLE